jgi:hypothetical protein
VSAQHQESMTSSYLRSLALLRLALLDAAHPRLAPLSVVRRPEEIAGETHMLVGLLVAVPPPDATDASKRAHTTSSSSRTCSSWHGKVTRTWMEQPQYRRGMWSGQQCGKQRMICDHRTVGVHT